MIYNIPDQISGDTWDGISTITIKENDSAVNLTDCDIFLQIRGSKNLASPVFLEMSTYNDKINIIFPHMGVIIIHEQKLDIPEGEYVYDLQVNFPNGEIKTYLKGSINILPQIKRFI